MNKLKLLILAALVMPFCTFVSAKNVKSIVAGYYRSSKKWQQRNPYTKIDCASYTHIFHIGSFPYDPATKKITVRDPKFFPNAEMVKYLHTKNIKVLLSLAGGNGIFVNKISKTPEDLEAYTTQVLDIVVKNNYDGIDIDWEHPGNKKQGRKWDKLIATLRKKLDEAGKAQNKKMLLSSALFGWSLWTLNTEGIKKNLDFINVMAYDIGMGGCRDHAKLSDVIKNMKRWEKLNCPEKLLIGLPFYSYVYFKGEINKKYDRKKGHRRGQIDYPGVKKIINKNHWKKYSKDSNLYCSSDKKSFAALEDEKVIYNKSLYFKKRGYRGVFCWSVACDDFHDGSPLAKAMAAPWLKKAAYSKKPIRVVGYIVTRDFDEDRAEYLIDNSVFDYLTDAILLGGIPKLDKIQANDTRPQIKEFMKRVKRKKLMRWCSTAPSSGKAMGDLMANPEKIAKNTEAITQFLVNNNFDGLDIDWEYPTQAQWKAYSLYLIELKKALSKKGKKLSLAVAPWGKTVSPAAAVVIDGFNIMAYDLFGGNDANKHSSYQDAERAIKHFLKANIPAKKLRLGLPFYGHHLKPKSLSHSKWLFHNGYETMYKNFITLFPDLPSFQNTVDECYFNGIDMIKRKTNLAIDKKLGGVMIWEMGFDLPVRDSRSLLRSIIETASLAGKNKKALPKGELLKLPWPGGLSSDIWLKIPGSKISDLTASPNYPNKPSYKGFVYNLNPRSNWESEYGQRIYGFLTAPVSGEYTFWISGSNECALYLSFDDKAEGKKLIGRVKGQYPKEKIWDKSPSQKSPVIKLKAGKRYYIEVLHKEDKSKEHLAVAWKIPGKKREIISYKYLSPL